MLSLAVRTAIRLFLLVSPPLPAPAPLHSGAGSGPVETRTAAPRPDTGAVVTEVPDACMLLTSADARELLGEAVGEPYSADVAGLGNCAYRTADPGRQLTLIVQLGPDDAVEGTQLAIDLEYCGADVVGRPDGLGRGAALYRSPEAPCGPSLTLWVATGVGFEGRPNPDLFRPVTGRLHLVLSGGPFAGGVAEPDAALPALRGAAERALARLEELARP